ncbi:hypothetical protein [Blastochloris viridis]|uniref:Uncharacterized protein n=1 Tax=Blastochloris viridis TaxID=1079 RepID=A0A182CZP6_BLAVI|nr:hypothetical protein [Blastochloris viridis]ALK08040.1 hypothetical protein BVIR_224 [Blastochloris viridis]BAR98700.1 hypothetical protein BV133_1107 [Blastochloris viridis]
MSATDLPFDQGPASPPRRSLLARIGRIVTVMQAIGAVLAVPFGITTAYSVYSNNLSTAATCKGLRGSIVAAIDKNVDPDTQRRLIRRDVEAFEQSCGTVDPDALEAFRAVLIKDGPDPATPGPAEPSLAGPPPAATATQAAAPAAVPVPLPRPTALGQTRQDTDHVEAKPVEIRHPDPTVAGVRPGDGVTGSVVMPMPVEPPPPLVEPAAPPRQAVKPRPQPPTAWAPIRPPADVLDAPTSQPFDPEQLDPADRAAWRLGNLAR